MKPATADLATTATASPAARRRPDPTSTAHDPGGPDRSTPWIEQGRSFMQYRLTQRNPVIAAYVSAMRSYATFSGRASRGEFWCFHFWFATLLLGCAGVDSFISEDPDTTMAPVIGLVLVIHLLPSVAACVRRLHDVGRSGWLYLVGLVPFVGPVVLLVWFCRKGADGANRFGPAPLATLAASVARGGQFRSAVARDPVAEIERLVGMRANGALSKAEFETLKSRVLAGLAPT